MHLRLSTVRQNNRTYRYAQLVQSYRRPTDGLPAHRVIAHLGALADCEIENLRTALEASRRNQRVAVLPKTAIPQKILQNLRYLDIAVCMRSWQNLQLDSLLDDLIPTGDALVPLHKVITALVMQRCVEPGSKLLAQRWFPKTALPELLAVPPGQFNNTRIHRALDALHRADEDLQRTLAQRLSDRDPAFAALFLDVTDTWFVGQGPKIAKPCRTKEGLYRRAIGITLMCNEKGYPLRWSVASARHDDASVMTQLLEQNAQTPWIAQTPLVVDRAMGATAHLEHMHALGLKFVTALTRTEFDAYAKGRIPYQDLLSLDSGHPEDVKTARDLVTRAGLQGIDETLCVRDLGQVERSTDATPPPDLAASPPRLTTAHQALALAEAMARTLEREAGSLAHAARAVGLSTQRASDHMRLLALSPQIQEIIREGLCPLALKPLTRIARLPEQQQAHAYAEACGRNRSGPRRGGALTWRGPLTPATEPLALRAVLAFNPEIFVRQREHAAQTLARLYRRQNELNAQLARTPRRPETVRRDLERELHRHHWVEAFEVRLEGTNTGVVRVQLHRRESAWEHLRRFDGFLLIVAWPECALEAADLVRLYRAKDAVEKDFQTIKSVVELRPVRHRIEAKVRAHVTLCMLALLVRRTLEQTLKELPDAPSVAACFEQWKTIHLNRVRGSAATPTYTVTDVPPDGLRLLQALDMAPLVDDDAVADTLHPR
jgi:hypothetical protein